MLSFGIYLLDDNNKEITFVDALKKVSILNFKIDVWKNNVKEEKINFSLEGVEKNLAEYKKAIELKDKKLPDIKKFCRVLKEVTTPL